MLGLEFDPDQLQSALTEIPESAWSLPSSYAGTGVHHGYRRVVLVSSGLLQEYASLFGFVLDRLSPVRDAWLSWIGAGGFIVPHRDAGPWRERWQVPICASGEWHGTESFRPASGAAFQVEHWLPHSVVNRGASPRVHLVLDRDVLLDRAPEPFATYPIPEDVADLIARSST